LRNPQQIVEEPQLLPNPFMLESTAQSARTMSVLQAEPHRGSPVSTVFRQLAGLDQLAPLQQARHNIASRLPKEAFPAHPVLAAQERRCLGVDGFWSAEQLNSMTDCRTALQVLIEWIGAKCGFG